MGESVLNFDDLLTAVAPEESGSRVMKTSMNGSK